MEDNDLIGNLRKAADSLEKFQQASQDTQTDIQNAMQEDSTDNESNTWDFKDTIDTLVSRVTGGYTYYDIPWDERNKPKQDNNRYNIMDDSGDNVEVNTFGGAYLSRCRRDPKCLFADSRKAKSGPL